MNRGRPPLYFVGLDFGSTPHAEAAHSLQLRIVKEKRISTSAAVNVQQDFHATLIPPFSFAGEESGLAAGVADAMRGARFPKEISVRFLPELGHFNESVCFVTPWFSPRDLGALRTFASSRPSTPPRAFRPHATLLKNRNVKRDQATSLDFKGEYTFPLLDPLKVYGVTIFVTNEGRPTYRRVAFLPFEPPEEERAGS